MANILLGTSGGPPCVTLEDYEAILNVVLSATGRMPLEIRLNGADLAALQAEERGPSTQLVELVAYRGVPVVRDDHIASGQLEVVFLRGNP